MDKEMKKLRTKEICENRLKSDVEYQKILKLTKKKMYKIYHNPQKDTTRSDYQEVVDMMNRMDKLKKKICKKIKV